MARKPLIGTVAANVEAHGTGGLNIDACRVDATEAPRASGGRSGAHDGTEVLGNGGLTKRVDRPDDALGRWPANLIHDGSEEVLGLFPQTGPSNVRPPTGKDNRGVPGFVMRLHDTQERGVSDLGGSAARFFYCAKASKADRGDNKHPTVKPTGLMRYLCRLVTPKGGTVLDPFMGSGSTGKAAEKEGFRFVGIELDAEYLAIACERIENAQRQERMFP
jgi:site-specific DNA-methyltransferase (adenine-specific)